MRRGSALAWLCVAAALVVGQEQTPNSGKSQREQLSWAWQTPTRPSLPKVKHHDWVKNPIDAFIAEALEREGIAPGPAADRLTLIRRLSFDLSGLPPTPDDIDRFLKDASADAYEKLVNRLLASPRYGERWAMYWLDLVRFAESDGFKADDLRPNAWRYRDYVIKSLNQDKPYDRFIREQLAGDELYPGDPEALVATAFNRHHPDEHNQRNLELRRQEILNDMTDTTAAVFLGMTVACARCHDHKYDPITQKDYYRLQAFFAAYWARDAAPVAAPEQLVAYEAGLSAWRKTTAGLQHQMQALEEPVRQSVVSHEKMKFPRAIREAFDTPAEKRTPYQKQLADLVSKQLAVKTDVMTKAMKPEVRQEWQNLQNQMAEFDRLKPPPLAGTLALTDISPLAPRTFLLQRGNWDKKGAEVEPGFFEILDAKSAPIPTPSPEARTTGRRSVLADWLTRPDHPLTARVMVNRLWQHHFGRGIVGTPSDFGILGAQPSHPELLDWLAREFSERGWSLKAMHRLMVTSATYRQSSRFRAAAAEVDPDNRLLWRMNRRRLEGEALRDAMLAASGLLNLKAGGPSVFPALPGEMKLPAAKWPVTADVREHNRRSVYVFVKRNLRYPMFDVFDAPDSNESCARRHVSISAPQALLLLNSKITLDVAQALAGRVLRHGPPDQAIERLYRLALGRLPSARERNLAADFLEREREAVRERLTNKLPVLIPRDIPPEVESAFAGALVDLCHVMLNTNEFAYVD